MKPQHHQLCACQGMLTDSEWPLGRCVTTTMLSEVTSTLRAFKLTVMMISIPDLARLSDTNRYGYFSPYADNDNKYQFEQKRQHHLNERMRVHMQSCDICLRLHMLPRYLHHDSLDCKHTSLSSSPLHCTR